MASNIRFYTFVVLVIASIVFSNGSKIQQKENLNSILSNNVFCENKLSAYYISDNTNVVANSSAVIKNVSETQCLEFCSNNRDQKGRLVFCASVVYESKNELCTIYRQNSAPDGELKQNTVFGQRYFEKFCLAEDLPATCIGKQFVRVNEYILKGYAQATSNVASLAECVAECVREKKFECKSAMYFYEEGECITNLESAITQPEDFFKPNDDDKVIFFHNGCIDEAVSDNQNNNVEVISTDDIELEDQSVTKAVSPNSEIDIASSTSESSTEFPTTKTIKETATQESIEEIIKKSTTIVTTKKLLEETTDNETITTNGVTETTTTNESALSIKPSKLSMRNKIKPIVSQSTIALIEPVNTPLFDKIQFEENTKKVASLNLTSSENILAPNTLKQFYGAKQLETTVDGLFQEKVFNDSTQSSVNNTNDGGPERPPSGQIVVEDLVNNAEKEHESLLKSGFEKKPFLATTAPRALMPKILINDSLNVKPIKSQENKTFQTETDKPQQQQIKQLPKIASLVEAKVGKEKQYQLKTFKKISAQNEAFFGQWGEWTPCNEAGERKIRRRKCFDLRECIGPLMQVDYCPRNIQQTETSDFQNANPKENMDSKLNEPVGPIKTPLPINVDSSMPGSVGLPPSILPAKLPPKELKPLPAGAPGRPEDIWSPWLDSCQHFASVQPCKNNQVIGFESRECIAKDPKACKGPFFRYCTLPC